MAAKRPTSRPAPTKPPQQPLVLNRRELRKSMAELFDHLDTNPKARERFIQNPSGLISERVFQEKLPPQRSSEANRLLFAVLSNERFKQWLDAYAARNQGRRVRKEEFNQDFAKALVEFGDHELLVSVLSNASAGFGLSGTGDRAQQFIINNAAGTTFVTDVNTPSTSNQTSHSNQNLDNKSSGFGFGDLGRLIDPAILRSLSEQLLARARELKESGALADLSQRIR